jgi:hypothetical protein
MPDARTELLIDVVYNALIDQPDRTFPGIPMWASDCEDDRLDVRYYATQAIEALEDGGWL